MLPNRWFAGISIGSRAFSVVELLVIVVMIGVIAGLILPSLAKARQKVEAQESLEYGRSIGAAFQRYSKDNDGRLVPVRQKEVGWAELLVTDTQKHGAIKGGIGYNKYLSDVQQIDSVHNPSMTVAFGDTGIIQNPTEKNPNLWREILPQRRSRSLVFDTPLDKGWNEGKRRMINRHRGRATAIFVDGAAVLVPVRYVGFEYESGDSRSLWDNK
jgi:type II secretory pathway pseudopilin PulG